MVSKLVSIGEFNTNLLTWAQSRVIQKRFELRGSQVGGLRDSQHNGVQPRGVHKPKVQGSKIEVHKIDLITRYLITL